MGKIGRPKPKTPMTHDYHIRLDNRTWEYLQILRKDDPKFNIAAWIRSQIKLLYSQRIFYKQEWDLLDYRVTKEGKHGRKEKETGKTPNAKKTR